jgi:AcrR family transcriptional regulator
MDGLTNITSRDLAKSLGISHGNLEYHFPNKEALLIAIYDEMKSKLSEFYQSENQNLSNPITQFHRLLERLDDFQNEYSFFCKDIVEICRKYQKVNQDLESNLRIREGQMAVFFQKFIDHGYMKSEPTKNYYKRLQHTIRILITFWLSQEKVITNFTFRGKGEMVVHIWELLTPHFTTKGQLEYKKIKMKPHYTSN